jgi:hypothetical protein
MWSVERARAEAMKLIDELRSDPAAAKASGYECAAAINALHMYGGTLDAEMAWELLAIARRFKYEALEGSLFESLARNDAVRARPILSEAMTSGNGSTRNRAASAWLIANGLPTAWEASDAVPQSQLEEWPREVHHIMALVSLINQVVSGGFSQWFCSGDGCSWEITAEAARAIGAPGTAALIERAVDVFRNGEELDQVELNWRLTGPQDEQVVESLALLSAQFCDEDWEPLEPLMAEYIFVNRDSFAWFDPE